MKPQRTLCSALIFFAAAFGLLTGMTTAFGQVDRQRAIEDRMNPSKWDERDEIRIPAADVHLVKTYEVGRPEIMVAPTIADVASVYSTTTATFGGSAFAPAGQANTPAITRLMADDLTLVGTAPFVIGRFDFSMCNLNAAAVSARPRIRLYSDAAGLPGTNITGFSFAAITVPAGSCSTFFSTLAIASQFTVPTNTLWAGMVFDNSGATATAAQIDLFGMGIFPTPDIGSSSANFYLTTAAPPAGGSYLVNNPGPGAITSITMQTANFGWDFRRAATIASITRNDFNPRQASQTASWNVTLAASSVTGLTASNFTLTGTHTGASITSVTANNVSPSSTSWTVTAQVGPGAGTVGLNWANATGLTNTALTNTLPFAGEIYDVLVPSSANSSISGRVTAADGRGIGNAIVSVTGGDLATPRFVRTGSLGYFTVENLPAGETYVLTINSKRSIFSNPSRVITLNDSITDADFTADPQ